jgi:predicted dithiol-disulfide oxidoreductase (DUF899 family)
MNRPEIVDAPAWQAAREDLLVAEKEATRVLDALAARRRRLPMTPFPTDHVFATPDGPRSLLDLFGPHRQLVTYQFMDRGPDHYCSGCTWFTDNVPAHAPGLLAENGVSWVTVTDMPLEQFTGYRERKGWTMPYASSRGTSFSADTGAGDGFLLSVWLRDGDEVHRTYTTTSRGIDRHAFVTGLLDLTPFGRGETWEDSPDGWPQVPAEKSPCLLSAAGVATSYGRWRG